MWDALLAWMRGLSPTALYAVAALSAALENAFPPLPSDAVVAFAAFAAARGRGSAPGALAAVLVGNVAGAMAMYGVGVRYGATTVLRRLGGANAQEATFRRWYARYGTAAIVVSRLVPGVRAIVPPVAGALGIGAVRAAIAMAIPSAIWYSAITYTAFTAGGDLATLRTRLVGAQRYVGLTALALVALAVAGWLLQRRRARARG